MLQFRETLTHAAEEDPFEIVVYLRLPNEASLSIVKFLKGCVMLDADFGWRRGRKRFSTSCKTTFGADPERRLPKSESHRRATSI